MAGSRRNHIPVESSWRMVEGGENDSFDTSIVRDEEDEEIIVSSGSDPSQISQLSQLSNFSQFSGSQPFSFGGSQDDNIENFLTKAEKGEQVINRSPFQPSIPRSVRESSREDMRHRSPDPEFYMPTVEIDSLRVPSTRSSSTRTVRPAPPTMPGLRHRQPVSRGTPESPTRKPRPRGKPSRYPEETPSSVTGRVSESLPGAMHNVLGWLLGVIGLTFHYVQKPLAVCLAIYLAFGAVIIAKNCAETTITKALSPICRVPGLSLLGLPFCENISPSPENRDPVEFDDLMGVQERFEEVLEKSAQGVSLPLEMKRSEASVRDLRTLVRYSNLQGKEELVLEFDGFIDIARSSSNELQKFNTHVGSAVDSVISINRWTSRYLDGLATEIEQDREVAASGPGGWLMSLARYVFAPLRPGLVFSERHLLDKYVEHTALVSDKIADLIVEAQAVLHTLGRAEDHLGIIYDFVTLTQKSVQGRRDDVLWTLWTLVGANTRHLHNLNEQLQLLKRVDSQRSDAVAQVSELVVELQKIQAGLGDLRDRVAEPELVRGKVAVPLSVHIDTIDRGVERLEAARSRMRAVENDRIREVLARGKPEGRMIDSI